MRVLVRNAEKLRDVPWRRRVDIVEGDIGLLDDVQAACDDVDVFYYLIHGMGQPGDFEASEKRGAQNAARAAVENGVSRIVYLGGLHPQEEDLSKHLRSRKDVGDILLDSGVPTIALQAGVIIGSGSTSFEMIRHLTDVLPVMTAPKWVGNMIQPIAVRDVLHYLIRAADLPASCSARATSAVMRVARRAVCSCARAGSCATIRRWPCHFASVVVSVPAAHAAS